MECLLYSWCDINLPLPSRVGHLWLSVRLALSLIKTCGCGDLVGGSPSGTLHTLREA